ncbi:MAG: TetR/AcrR family transcriptional regulator [Pseudomonadales bacterium]
MTEKVKTTGSTQRIYRSEKQVRRDLDIIQVTRALVGEYGYDDWTMDQLARKVGIARKTLYNLYSSKDELVLAATIDLVDQVATVDALTSAPGIDQVLERQAAVSGLIQNFPEYARTVSLATFQASPNNPLTRYSFDNAKVFNLEHLQIAQAADEIRPGRNLELISHNLVTHYWGSILFWVKDMIELSEFERAATVGQLTLLAGVTRGKRQKSLIRQLERIETTERTLETI